MQTFWHSLPKPFFVLAPMEQVTDVIFRHVIQKAGAPDVFYTEFANATGWVHAGSKGIGGRLIKTGDEHPIVAQIWGGKPGDLKEFAKYCAALGFDGIDINMGCPAKSAVKSGGAALICQPALAAEAIAAAKTAGLPVSVKTRLGYSRVEEWRDWLTHILQQDIAALTIHLRTKKEMSKVPAHWELVPQIKQLRDEIAPQTLLVINGDIKNRAGGEQLAKEYGVDGVMIGRGIFTDPFAFTKKVVSSKQQVVGGNSVNTAHATRHNETPPLVYRRPELDSGHAENATAHGLNQVQTDEGSGGHRTDVSTADYLEPELGEAPGTTVKPDVKAGGGGNSREGAGSDNKQALINLLYYHLDLYDQYAAQTSRPFETLKRFFKIYIRDFDGASDLREKLMHTKSTDEVRTLLLNL